MLLGGQRTLAAKKQMLLFVEQTNLGIFAKSSHYRIIRLSEVQKKASIHAIIHLKHIGNLQGFCQYIMADMLNLTIADYRKYSALAPKTQNTNTILVEGQKKACLQGTNNSVHLLVSKKEKLLINYISLSFYHQSMITF